jgi:serine/threonine protein kinase
MNPHRSSATVTAGRPLSIPAVKIVSPQEMDRHFKLVKELGSGSFGVALLINVITNPEAAPLVPLGCQQVVFKKLRPDIPDHRRAKVARDLAAEGIILQQLDGLQGVPRLYGITSLITTLQPILVQEYIPGPSLIRFLNFKLAGQPRSIRRRFFWNFARSLLRVINGLHRRHIVHGDIKTDNIILRQPSHHSATDPLHLSNLDVHLIDFGLSLIVEPHTYDWQAAQQLPLCFSQWHSSQEQLKALQAVSTYSRPATSSSSSSSSSFSKEGFSSLGGETTYPRFPLNELIADTFTGYRRAPEHIAPEVSLAGTKSNQDLYKQDAFSAGLVLDQALNKRQHPYRATPDYMGRSTAGLSYDPYSPRVQRYKPYTLRQPAQKLDPKVRQEEQDADMLLMFLTHYNYTNRWSISRALDFVEGRPAHYF